MVEREIKLLNAGGYRTFNFTRSRFPTVSRQLRSLQTAFVLSIASLAAAVAPAAAETWRAPSCESDVTGRRGPVTERPLPRFESVKADRANFRVGPGVEYKALWELNLPNLPVCVISEFQQWRRVELPTGERGWIHAALVSEKRYALFFETPGRLAVAPDATAATLAQAPPMHPMALLDCSTSWCEIEFDGKRGFARRSALWGVRLVDE